MYKEIWTIGRILQWTEQYFQSKGMDTPRLDGEVLLSHVLGKNRIYLYTNYDQPLEQEELDRYRPLVIERAKGHSVASLTGTKDFMGLTFAVNDKVLIPRPDTETLVEYVLHTYHQQDSLPTATGMGLDISRDALEIAAQNQEAFKLENRSEFHESDMFSYLEHHNELFDVIVSNPPYIRLEDKKILSPDVLNEPHIALFGGEDGLDFYRQLAMECVTYLKPHGLVALEVGYDQAETVKSLLEAVGSYVDISFAADLAGINRVVTARVKG